MCDGGNGVRNMGAADRGEEGAGATEGTWTSGDTTTCDADCCRTFRFCAYLALFFAEEL